MKRRLFFLYKLAIVSLTFLFWTRFFPFTVTKAVESSTGTNSVTSSSEESDAQKEKEIEDKKAELKRAEERAKDYEARTLILSNEATSLESALGEIEERIRRTEEALLKTQKEIDKVQGEIETNQGEIFQKEKSLKSKRVILAEFIKNIHRVSDKSFLEALLSTDSIGEYFQEIAYLNKVSTEVKEIYDELKIEKKGLIIEKEKLEVKSQGQANLKIMQEQQRKYLEKDKNQKDSLLKETQGKEILYQKLLTEKKEQIVKITEEITSLQSLGESINFEEAIVAARFASEKTGVRVPYLLGVLRVESNMGNNVGGGRYQTDMHKAQREIFEEICAKLDYDPKKMPVSKKPCYKDKDGNCGGWGGAMGPAQFMPSTWRGYEKKIMQVLGTDSPDPWNLRHALVAMGLKLAKVDGVLKGSREAEKKAANIYLAGSNWENFTWYGDRVMQFADVFEEKIKNN
jgi:peptidoglycan hydrolase CwlO-like protein